MDNFEEKPIGVYIRIDQDNNIIEINSDIFIEDLSGWIKIDEGFGDKYAHAQSQYFDESLINEDGQYTYMYSNGRVLKNLYANF